MTNESIVRLLKSKLQMYRIGYSRDSAKGNMEAVAKWKEGYQETVERIQKLEED